MPRGSDDNKDKKCNPHVLNGACRASGKKRFSNAGAKRQNTRAHDEAMGFGIDAVKKQ